VNPYSPPKTPTPPLRKSPAGERSPAEAAFDFIFLPLIACGFIVGFFEPRLARVAGAGQIWSGLALAAAFLLLLHWVLAVRRVYRSWHDPFGSVLRFVSTLLLLIEALVIGTVLRF
jgi:hypothetical protein